MKKLLAILLICFPLSALAQVKPSIPISEVVRQAQAQIDAKKGRPARKVKEPVAQPAAQPIAQPTTQYTTQQGDDPYGYTFRPIIKRGTKGRIPRVAIPLVHAAPQLPGAQGTLNAQSTQGTPGTRVQDSQVQGTGGQYVPQDQGVRQVQAPRVRTPRVEATPRVKAPRAQAAPRVKPQKVKTERAQNEPRVTTPRAEPQKVKTQRAQNEPRVTTPRAQPQKVTAAERAQAAQELKQARAAEREQQVQVAQRSKQIRAAERAQQAQAAQKVKQIQVNERAQEAQAARTAQIEQRAARIKAPRIPTPRIAPSEKRLAFANQLDFSNKFGLSLSTNGLMWATGIPNIDLRLQYDKFSLIGSVGYANWGFPEQKFWWLTSVSGELRYDIIPNVYIGAAYNWSSYNFKISGTGNQGLAQSLGVVVGYKLPIGRKLALDFGLGLGYALISNEKYHQESDLFIRDGSRTFGYWGPIKAQVSLVWRIL